MMISDPRRYLVRETAIGSGMNVVMSLAATFVSSGGKFGPPGTADVLLQSFMVTLMSVLVATRLTRTRRKREQLNFGYDARSRLSRLAPRNAVARALLAGLVCLSIVTPIIRTMLPTLRAAAPAPAEVGAATAGYALLLSLLIIPAALVLAMNEDLTA